GSSPLSPPKAAPSPPATIWCRTLLSACLPKRGLLGTVPLFHPPAPLGWAFLRIKASSSKYRMGLSGPIHHFSTFSDPVQNKPPPPQGWQGPRDVAGVLTTEQASRVYPFADISAALRQRKRPGLRDKGKP